MEPRITAHAKPCTSSFIIHHSSMKTKQPSFWCVENIGDVDPFEYGGAFVLVDRTGTYNPELLILEVEDSYRCWLVSIKLEPLTRIKAEDGFHGLSDNKFHPEFAAWFGDSQTLKAVASSSGRPYYALLDSFLSDCPVERAFAYMDVINNFGAEAFGSERREIEDSKAKALCDTMLSQIKQSKTWHIGYGINA